MIVHQHDIENYYVCPCEDHGGPMPHNCVSPAPPARPWAKVWGKWTGKKWQMVEDHRERRTDGGFANEDLQAPTDYWLPAPAPEADTYQSPARHMTAIGPLPAGAVLECPEKPQSAVDAERVLAIKSSLDEIDRKSSRPLRAVSAGMATTADLEALKVLEIRAQDLRDELAALPVAAKEATNAR